jgi:hypothetical protein
VLEFENATVTFDGSKQPEFIAQFQNGSTRSYGNPATEPSRKLWRCIEAARTGEDVECSALSSLPHVLCVAAAQISQPQIGSFPRSMLTMLPEDHPNLQGRMLVAEGLREVFDSCFDRGVLPSELGSVEWTQPGRVVPISAVLNRVEPIAAVA